MFSRRIQIPFPTGYLLVWKATSMHSFSNPTRSFTSRYTPSSTTISITSLYFLPLLYFFAARITNCKDVCKERRDFTFNSFDRSLVPMIMQVFRGRQPQISSAFRIPRGVSIRLQISYFQHLFINSTVFGSAPLSRRI